jgi:hypothetical protein
MPQARPSKRDGAGLIALGETRCVREAARWRQSAEAESSRRDRAACRESPCLRHVVAHQPGFGERTSQAQLVFLLEPVRLQRLREHGDRVGMPAAFEGCLRPASAG